MGKRDQIKHLTQRLLDLKSEQQHLEKQRSGLLYSEAVLVSLCDCFELMAVQTQAQSLIDNEHNVEHLLQLQTELLNELVPKQQDLQSPLLQQRDLQHIQGSLIQQGQDVERIAPRHDPMAYFKHLLMQPAVQKAATMTARELAGSVREAVLHSSMELQRTQLRHLPPDVQALQQIFDRHHAHLMSAIIHGRSELIAQVNSYNLQDMTDAPDTLPAIITRQAEIAAVLGLTEQQVQDIATGSALFSRLMQSILEEQRQAQEQCDSSTSPSSSSSSSSSSQAFSPLDSLHQDWEARQQRTRRVQVLLRKEYAVRAAAAAWVAGCLSWEQYAKAAIAAWPSVLLVTHLAVSIPKYAEKLKCQ